VRGDKKIVAGHFEKLGDISVVEERIGILYPDMQLTEISAETTNQGRMVEQIAETDISCHE
jgi:hypothetical protein